MKIVSRKKKITLIVIAALIAVVLLGAIVAIISLIPQKEPEADPAPTIYFSIDVSRFPNKREYQIGDEFDPTGIKIQVISNYADKSYFIDHTDPELKFSGFDSSEAKDQLTITVTYKEFITFFNVKINGPAQAKPKLVSIRLSDNFYSTYSLDWWKTYGPTLQNLKLICTYDDGSEKEVPLQTNWCSGINRNIEAPGTTEFNIRYSEDGVEVSTAVTVTITE